MSERFRTGFTWALVIFIFLLDQLSKFIVSQNLNLNQSVTIIKNLFHLTLVHNTGAAFGIFKNQTLFFIIISILTAVTIAIYIGRRSGTSVIRDAALSLILGGALGNLVDRFRFGYVVDFLDFKIWPVFNVADSAITIGAFLLIVSLFRRGPVPTRDTK